MGNSRKKTVTQKVPVELDHADILCRIVTDLETGQRQLVLIHRVIRSKPRTDYRMEHEINGEYGLGLEIAQFLKKYRVNHEITRAFIYSLIGCEVP